MLISGTVNRDISWRKGIFAALVGVACQVGDVAAGAEPVTAAAAGAGQSSLELGKRIYREGITASGEPLSAVVQSDVPLPGTLIACGDCHQRSGLGSSEGSTLTPGVTGALLFQPRTIQRKQMYASRMEGPGTRPAYTDESLVRAIRQGMDPAGRTLDDLMPRYALSDEDMGHLTDYLKSLSSGPSPGVTQEVIHFATVVTEGVPPEKRNAMLAVLEAFFRDKNAGTRHEKRRVERSPWYKEWKYLAYRQWVLHLWDLTGSVETWSAQLEQYYDEQPVFALLSGLGTGEWRPVHEFCERFEVPCLLPQTDLPVISGTDFYSVYFSEGISLEAKVLAKYLVESIGLAAGAPIVQVYRDDAKGAVAARAFRQALPSDRAAVVRDRALEASEQLTNELWTELAQGAVRPLLVLWLDDVDLGQLGALADKPASIAGIYLSSSLVPGQRGSVPAGLWDKTFFVYPFALPEDAARKLARVKPWLRAKKIEMTDERVQMNAYFAVRVAGDALMHCVGNLYRDYFVEKIEHRVTTGMVTPSVYPYVSLGPGQRFLSKGSYIAKPAAQSRAGLSAASGWIVPD